MTDIIISVLGSSVITYVISAVVYRRKISAEADSVVVKNILLWAQELKQQITRLEVEIQRLTDENNNLVEEINKLKGLLNGPK